MRSENSVAVNDWLFFILLIASVILLCMLAPSKSNPIKYGNNMAKHSNHHLEIAFGLLSPRFPSSPNHIPGSIGSIN